MANSPAGPPPKVNFLTLLDKIQLAHGTTLGEGEWGNPILTKRKAEYGLSLPRRTRYPYAVTVLVAPSRLG